MSLEQFRKWKILDSFDCQNDKDSVKSFVQLSQGDLHSPESGYDVKPEYTHFAVEGFLAHRPIDERCIGEVFESKGKALGLYNALVLELRKV